MGGLKASRMYVRNNVRIVPPVDVIRHGVIVRPLPEHATPRQHRREHQRGKPHYCQGVNDHLLCAKVLKEITLTPGVLDSVVPGPLGLVPSATMGPA